MPNSVPQSRPLHAELHPAAERGMLLADPMVLAVIGFGGHTAIDEDDPRSLHIALPQILGEPQLEVWRADRLVRPGRDREFALAETDDLLFASLCLNETRFESLEAATAHAYAELLALLERRGYPHLVRIWNYFPRITDRDTGTERYHGFCLGRHRVLEPIPDFERDLPAATAIGTDAPGLLIYFIAAREPGRQVENPRQVSAFRYPERYSPRSPTFSRATLKDWGDTRHLYISGTASIVGHESLHIDAPEAQIDEILRNLDALITEAGISSPLGIESAVGLSMLKVYVRDPARARAIADHLSEQLDRQPPTLFLRGDICREELALEIEALFQSESSLPGED